MPTVRLERKGLYGPVGVVDTASARRFTIGGVLQGASLLRPAASSVDRALAPGPGPVTETRYQLAWMLAGQRHPVGRGLMLGLGGGCGAVGLLHQFPDISIDAVDADPAMVEMAREFHPLVRHYELLGRLRPHVAEATRFLSTLDTAYDFAIVDLVIDADRAGQLDSLPLIEGIAGASTEIWFRMFGSLPDGEIQPLLDKLAAVGRPVQWLYSPVSIVVPIPKPRDWILVAGVPRPPDPDLLLPFAGLAGPELGPIRRAYRKLASNPLRPPG